MNSGDYGPLVISRVIPKDGSDWSSGSGGETRPLFLCLGRINTGRFRAKLRTTIHDSQLCLIDPRLT